MKNTIFVSFIVFIFSTFSYAQSNIYDDFSKKDLSHWITGGIEIKYSHESDNRENGYAEIFTTNNVKSNSYIGKIIRFGNINFTAGNYVNIMLQGINNDVYVRISLLYDIDNNGKFNEDKDIMLQSKPISIKFNGWKEIKIKLDAENFSIISNFNDDFTVTEEEAIAIQFEFETGKNFKESKFESGIALISEIVNKEITSESEKSQNKSEDKESYFDARNYPNPFNPNTTISYTLKQSTSVKLTVYDRLGREVKTLVDEQQSAGTYSVEFNASNLPSGIYFYRIRTPEKTEVRKMILAK